MASLRSFAKDNEPVRQALFRIENLAHTAPSWLNARKRAARTERYFLAAMIRVKNEARFLPEWIAHHLNLGLEHVFIYDNGSDDGTDEAARPFVEAGLATYVHWPQRPISPSANTDFLQRFGPQCKWVMHFDTDEFLIERFTGAAVSTLRSFTSPALAVNWRFFGSSWHDRIPAGLVTEQFCRASPATNRHVKVIAQPAEILKYRNSHNFYYSKGALARTSTGRPVFASFADPSPEDVLVLNHYMYRGREDYEKKSRVGFSDARGAKDLARHPALADSAFHDHNAVSAPLPASVTQSTAARLRAMGYDGKYFNSACERRA